MATRPKTPLESLLNPDATARLARYCKSRIDSLTSAMSDWNARRDIYEKQMRDDFTWRGAGIDRDSRYDRDRDPAGPNSIFEKQNDSLNVVGSIAEYMAARTTDDVIGTEPWMAVQPEGIEDKELADDLQKHSEWKLRKTSIKPAFIDAIDLAMGIGEGILKVSWHTDVDISESEEVVLHIGGKPVIAPTGEYLMEADLVPYEEQPVPEMIGAEEEIPMEGEDEFSNIPPFEEGGLLPGEELPIAEAAPAFFTSIKMPPGWTVAAEEVQWLPFAIEKTNVTYNGPKIGALHRKDFLCPLTIQSIEDSDFVGHRFEMRLSEARQRYQLTPDMVTRMKPEGTEAKAEVAKPVDGIESEESISAVGEQDPVILFVECWVKWDPMQDGKLRRMYILLAVQSEIIVEMDYIANRTPGGQVPFFPVRAKRRKNRWDGTGYYERFERDQEAIDRYLNLIGYRNRYNSDPARFVNLQGIAGDEDTAEIRLGPGETNMLKEGFTAEKVLSYVKMPDLDDRTSEIQELRMQVVQNRTGVSTAAQGDAGSLPANQTATGVESILQSGSVLARLPINQIRDDLEKATLYCIKLIYANMDVDEIFTYFEGDQQRAKTLEAARVSALDFNIRLLMTRFSEREKAEQAGKALPVFKEWQATAPIYQQFGKPLFVQMLKAFGIQDADAILQMAPPPAVDPATGQPLTVMPDPALPVEGVA